jgi:lipopolysaccharide export LptBFGC system permease protein LptF
MNIILQLIIGINNLTKIHTSANINFRGNFMETKILVKRIFTYFGFAFIFMFLALLSNQFILLFRGIDVNKPTIHEYLIMIICLLPTVFMMSIPFATCIGFIQAFVSIESSKLIGKKLFFITFCLGILLSFVNYFIIDFVTPKANLSFSKIYGEFNLMTEDNRLLSFQDSPRNMNSIDIIKSINNISKDKRTGNEAVLNEYKLELHKKYSLSLGVMIFSYFALMVSVFLYKKRIISLLIGILSCILYWGLFVYGEYFSIKYGKNGILVMWFPNIIFLCLSIVLHILYKYRLSSSISAANVKGFNGT